MVSWFFFTAKWRLDREITKEELTDGSLSQLLTEADYIEAAKVLTFDNKNYSSSETQQLSKTHPSPLNFLLSSQPNSERLD